MSIISIWTFLFNSFFRHVGNLCATRWSRCENRGDAPPKRQEREKFADIFPVGWEFDRRGMVRPSPRVRTTGPFDRRPHFWRNELIWEVAMKSITQPRRAGPWRRTDV